MSSTPRVSREIDGKGRTVRELLSGRKYSIDYYQREYKWQKKQVADLLEDLAVKFLESHEEGNERSDVAEYGHYFLGSIIISDKDGQKFIIDGQQRLTTLTLILIFFQHEIADAEQKGQIADLIFSQKFGKRSFNLDIPERTACMEALYKGEEFHEANSPRQSPTFSPATRTSRSCSPMNSKGRAPLLCRLADGKCSPGRDHSLFRRRRYTIFETMNDRGLSLTPADMLKGYLLANISDSEQRTAREQRLEETASALQNSAKTRMQTESSPGCAASTH